MTEFYAPVPSIDRFYNFSVLFQMAVRVVHAMCISHVFFHYLIRWEHNRNQHCLLAVAETFPIYLTNWQTRPPMQNFHLPCNSNPLHPLYTTSTSHVIPACFTLVHHSLTPRRSLGISLFFIYIKSPFSCSTSSAVYVRPPKYSVVVFIILHPCCMLKQTQVSTSDFSNTRNLSVHFLTW
jgi:hypothetical protein